MLALPPDLSEYLEKTSFNPDNLVQVWSGSATSVALSSLSDTRAGVYLVVAETGILDYRFMVYLSDPAGYDAGSANVTTTSNDVAELYGVVVQASSIKVRRVQVNFVTNGVSSQDRTIYSIWRVSE